MRIIVYGVGAIGGVVAAALALSGQEVIGIARGKMLDAIRENGLTLRSFRGEECARFDCVAAPSEIDFRDDDIVLLTMKSQDTLPALDALRDAGLRDQPIFCCQNGVANERTALRRFPNVHGVTVMMPATYLEPGRVSIRSEPRFGIFDIGRFPQGHDAADDALAAALERANVAAFVMDDVMASKYGKLLLNLHNIVEASLGYGVERKAVVDRITAEGRTVLEAAGIAWHEIGPADPRRDDFMRTPDLGEEVYLGGSTTQSLARGAASIETDYLNGEISLLARLHGVSSPLNDRLSRLSADLVRSGRGPGSMTLDELNAWLDA